jgi:hypothetical protein
MNLDKNGPAQFDETRVSRIQISLFTITRYDSLQIFTKNSFEPL